MSALRLSLACALLVVSALSYAGEAKDSVTANQSIINTVVNCATATGNPVVNCGFETGDLTGWIQSGDPSFTGVDSSSAHSGAFGAFFGPTSDFGCITQFLPTPVFFAYDLSFWLKNSGQPNGLLVYWDGNLITQWSNAGNFNYTQVSFLNLPTPGSTTELDFCFFNPPDFFRLDDVVAAGH